MVIARGDFAKARAALEPQRLVSFIPVGEVKAVHKALISRGSNKNLLDVVCQKAGPPENLWRSTEGGGGGGAGPPPNASAFVQSNRNADTFTSGGIGFLRLFESRCFAQRRAFK